MRCTFSIRCLQERPRKIFARASWKPKNTKAQVVTSWSCDTIAQQHWSMTTSTVQRRCVQRFRNLHKSAQSSLQQSSSPLTWLSTFTLAEVAPVCWGPRRLVTVAQAHCNVPTYLLTYLLTRCFRNRLKTCLFPVHFLVVSSVSSVAHRV